MVGRMKEEDRDMLVDGRREHKRTDGRPDSRSFRGLPGVPAAWLDCEGPGGSGLQGPGEECEDNGCKLGSVVLLAGRRGNRRRAGGFRDGYRSYQEEAGTGGLQ